jgi:hypothetical protein
MIPEGGILYRGSSWGIGHRRRSPAEFRGVPRKRSSSSGGHGFSPDINREHIFATPNLHEAYRNAKVSH